MASWGWVRSWWGWMWSARDSPGAHFATFPPKLIAPLIQMGSSEQGCCAACGAPWKRVVQPDTARAAQLGKAWTDHVQELQVGHRIGRNAKTAAGGYVTTGMGAHLSLCVL